MATVLSGAGSPLWRRRRTGAGTRPTTACARAGRRRGSRAPTPGASRRVSPRVSSAPVGAGERARDPGDLGRSQRPGAAARAVSTSAITAATAPAATSRPATSASGAAARPVAVGASRVRSAPLRRARRCAPGRSAPRPRPRRAPRVRGRPPTGSGPPGPWPLRRATTASNAGARQRSARGGGAGSSEMGGDRRCQLWRGGRACVPVSAA